MERRELIRQRAAVAARLNRDLMSKKFYDRLAASAPTDEDGDLIVKAVCSEESAVLTIHRFERSGDRTVAMATILDNEIRVIVMQLNQRLNDEAISIPGDVTVGDWIHAIDQAPGSGFTADGQEFAPEINGIALTVV